ncbi:MAG: HAD family hydrolase [Bacillota bacterium]
MLEKYKGIIFDLDGTLIDSLDVWTEIDKAFFKKRNIIVDRDLYPEVKGKSYTETVEYLKKTFDLKKSIENLKEERNILAQEFYKKVKLKRNVLKLLDYLKDNNKKIGLATSNSRHLANTALNNLQIKKYFNVLVTSCDVNKGKPSPDVFLKTAKELNLNPSECIVFEDSIDGVKAAKSANIDVIAVYDKKQEKYKKELMNLANYYIRNYNELIK